MFSKGSVNGNIIDRNGCSGHRDGSSGGNIMVDVLKIRLDWLVQPIEPQIGHLLNLVH